MERCLELLVTRAQFQCRQSHLRREPHYRPEPPRIPVSLTSRTPEQIDTVGATAGWQRTYTRRLLYTYMETVLPLGQKLAVVVEDEWIIRMQIADVLADGGWDVWELASGEQALQFLITKREVTLLVTDIRLEGEVSGWKVQEA